MTDVVKANASACMLITYQLNKSFRFHDSEEVVILLSLLCFSPFSVVG